MSATEAWQLARAELLRLIKSEIASLPDGQQNIWFIEASDGDMSEFPTMLTVIDRVLGAEPVAWHSILREAETQTR